MTHTDPTDVGNGPCERCPSTYAVNYSPHFGASLCVQCLYVATEHELGPTVPRWIPIQPAHSWTPIHPEQEEPNP
jgi:hypothetical protein